MHTEQRARAHVLLSSRGIDRALFANPFNVTWLTSFAPPIQTGANLFAGGPPLVWYDSGQFTLIVVDAYTAPDGIPAIGYPGYTIATPILSASHLARIVRDLAGQSKSKLGVESRHLPIALGDAMPPDTNVATIDGWLDPLRMVKTSEELEKLRRAFALTDLAHTAARHAARVGAREIDVWTAAHSAVQQSAGSRIPFGNDCVVSYRENNIGGWPGDLALRPGDSLMVDLGVRVEGYWSDSCTTVYASGPTEQQKAMHQVAAQALEFAISLVKPGVLANDIDRQVRQFIDTAGYPIYPHHTGHGVGASPHEEPRIVPYNAVAIEPGMVLMLEPGIYFPKEAAVRLEDAVLVTADGAEVLTKHNK